MNPTSMRAAVMPTLGTIEIVQREVREPAPLEAVVRMEAVGVCGSDTAYYTVGYIGDYVVDGPIVLGHEAAGVVTRVGADVTQVAVGDRVAVEPGTPCRNCRQCMAGRYHLCPEFVFLATPPYDGALVEQLTIDSRQLFPIPDTMSFEEGALVEPLSVGIWACQRADLKPGEDVLVTGAGPVGLLAAAAAWAFGAGSVLLTDVSETRLQVARDLGFETEHGERSSAREFDVHIEASGAPGVLAQGLARLRPAGRAAMVGMSKEKALALPLSQLNPNELTISLVNRYRDTWPTAISLIASGRVNALPLVTHHFPLAESEQALTIGATDPTAIKAVVHPQR